MQSLVVRWFQSLTGQVFIPAHLENSHPKLLHFSDTPRLFYHEMNRLIEKIDPSILIHTGDCADQIKLELHPTKLDLYQKSLKQFSKSINTSRKRRLILCVGNHDCLKELLLALPNAEIIEEGAVIQIDDLSFYLSHYAPITPQPGVTFFLYGHAPDPPTQLTENPYFLNGLEGIHVIDLTTHEITKLDYPNYLMAYRMNLYKTGL